jgi:hypothetical protein
MEGYLFDEWEKIRHTDRSLNWDMISRNNFDGEYYKGFSRWKATMKNVHEELLYSPYLWG